MSACKELLRIDIKNRKLGKRRKNIHTYTFLTSDQDHGSVLHMDEVRHACMLLLLVLNSDFDDFSKFLVSLALAHHVPQRDLRVAKETDL